MNLKNLSPDFILKRFVIAVIAIRVLCGLIHCFFPITMPHQWRQVDTMSVSLRYFLRWIGEGQFQVPWWATAVLNSQGTSGVMPMEFPFLNWVGAAGFWLADTDLDRGRIYASLLVFLINLILLRLAYVEWRRCIDGFQKNYIPWAIVAGYFLSFSTPYSSKFMPDPMALLLATWGTAAIGRLKWWGILPFALGLAMKPTVGVVCLLLILTPLNLARLRFMGLLIAASIAPSAWWYKIVVPKIKLLQMQDDLFVIPTNFNPMTSVLEFWTSPLIWDVINFHAIWSFAFLLIVLGGVLWRRKIAKDRHLQKLFLILVVQASCIGLISGSYSHRHSYYLIGLSLTVMAIVLHLLVIYPQKWISYILLVGLLARTVEAGIADTQALWGKETKSQIFAECRWLRENFSTLPWRGSVSWRTPREEYPLIDLCLGVPGQSLKAEFGVFRRSTPIPSECLQIAETKHLVMFHCKTDF